MLIYSYGSRLNENNDCYVSRGVMERECNPQGEAEYRIIKWGEQAGASAVSYIILFMQMLKLFNSMHMLMIL